MPTKESRFSIALNYEYQKKLDDICKLLNIKQYSKAIIFLINYFFKVNEKNK